MKGGRALLGKSMAGRGNSKCKGSEVGMCLVSVRDSREASMNEGRSDGRCI